MGARLDVARKRTTEPSMVHSSLLVLFASWMLMRSAGCAKPQTIDCAPDEQLSADGSRCELIQCEGGEIENKECVCPANQVLDNDRCLAEDDPCIGFSCNDGNECTDDTCVAVGMEATCPFSPVNDGTSCNGGADKCVAGLCVARKRGTPQRIESDNAGSALASQVAIDPSGNALAVWYQSDGTRDNIWANRFEQRGRLNTRA